MNYVDALGQEIKVGDLVVFSSTVGGSRGTCIHFAEVVDIRPVKEGGVNHDSNVDLSVQTIYTTNWFERNASVRIRKPTIPKTSNVLKWTGPDPREIISAR